MKFHVNLKKSFFVWLSFSYSGITVSEGQQWHTHCCIFDDNLFICRVLSPLGPAVRYNKEFNKRIPVTGIGGSLGFIIIDDEEPISKIWYIFFMKKGIFYKIWIISL